MFLSSFFLKKIFIKIKKKYDLDPGVKPQDDKMDGSWGQAPG